MSVIRRGGGETTRVLEARPSPTEEHKTGISFAILVRMSWWILVRQRWHTAQKRRYELVPGAFACLVGWWESLGDRHAAWLAVFRVGPHAVQQISAVHPRPNPSSHPEKPAQRQPPMSHGQQGQSTLSAAR